jgi:molecular chaperone GrpE
MADVPKGHDHAEGEPADRRDATSGGVPAADTAASAGDLGPSDQPGGEVDEFDAAAQAVEVDIAGLVAERKEYLDLAQRAQADLENFKKMAQKRQDEAVARELGGFVERLLPVLDACDAAAAQGAADAVEPLVSALFKGLEREGLQRIYPKGETFDPAVAEAVVHEPGEGGPEVVAEVLRAGYRWQGRLLRPALVKVID